MRKYLIIIEKTDTGYSAFVPDLPGCIASGRTKEIVEKYIYEAIQFHIEGLKEMNYFSKQCWKEKWYKTYERQLLYHHTIFTANF